MQFFAFTHSTAQRLDEIQTTDEIDPQSPGVSRTTFEGIRAKGGFLWIDCVYADIARINPFLVNLGIAPLLAEHLQDAQNRQHPSFFDSTSHYEMLVLRGLAMMPSKVILAERPVELETRPSTLFLCQGALITVHAQSSRTFEKLKTRLLSSDEERGWYINRPEDLFLRICGEVVDRFLDLREPLSTVLEQAQYELLDPKRPFNDWRSLWVWRNETQRLQSLCEEQLDALQEWLDERLDSSQSVCGGPAFDDNLEVRTNNIVEHIKRVLTYAARLQASLDNAVQLHFSQTAHRSTEIMRVLTVLTAIFMPLTLITGIFGMNFQEIPGARHSDGFWWAIGGMLAVGLCLYLLFRTQRWISTGRSKTKPVPRPHPQEEST